MSPRWAGPPQGQAARHAGAELRTPATEKMTDAFEGRAPAAHQEFGWTSQCAGSESAWRLLKGTRLALPRLRIGLVGLKPGAAEYGLRPSNVRANVPTRGKGSM